MHLEIPDPNTKYVTCDACSFQWKAVGPLWAIIAALREHGWYVRDELGSETICHICVKRTLAQHGR